jgi:tRNA A-37 threonylcarbamoyl transferase component Bud32
MPSPREAIPRYALERGFVTEAQLSELEVQSERDSQDLLHLLAELLTPSQQSELRATYQRALTGADAPPTTQSTSADPEATLPRAAVADPEATLPRGAPPDLKASDFTPALLAAPLEPGSSSSKAPRRARTHIGPYEIVSELGRGGMGVVYRARHQELGRDVAIKLMIAHGLNDVGEARFNREAHALGRLTHPNIVTVHEAGLERQEPYIVLELVEGTSLKGHLKANGPLEPREAAEMLATLADALAHAHDEGVLHRDLKPGNVLLCTDGRPLLTDFGMARMSATRDRLTRTGQIVGTPAFMPPEQAEGLVSKIDERSDVYSLGATLFAALTGEAPFKGDSLPGLLLKVIDGPVPSPAALRPELDVDLCQVCSKCLAKAPEERYPDAASLAADLRRWLAGEPVSARPLGPLDRARAHRAVVGALALSLLVLGPLLVGLDALLVSAPAESTEVLPSATGPTPSSSPKPALQPLWTPEVGAEYEIVLWAEEGFNAAELCVASELRATVEAITDTEAKLQLEFERVRFRYCNPKLRGPLLDTGDTGDKRQILSTLRNLIGQRFVAWLDPRTGRCTRLTGLKAVRKALFAGHKEVTWSKREHTGFLEYLKWYLSDSAPFIQPAFTHLLQQAGEPWLPWRAASGGARRFTLGANVDLPARIPSLLRKFKVKADCRWTGTAAYETESFEGRTRREGCGKLKVWSELRLTMRRAP